MDHLKEGIGLRGYGQKNPLYEYQREGFEVFSEMMDNINRETAEAVFRASFIERRQEPQRPLIQSAQEEAPPAIGDRGFRQEDLQTNTSETDIKRRPYKRTDIKVGRNDPCPCGAVDPSGRPIKYKKCCGR
jgi:preprotein translocase subunit SecA